MPAPARKRVPRRHPPAPPVKRASRPAPPVVFSDSIAPPDGAGWPDDARVTELRFSATTPLFDQLRAEYHL